MTPSGAEVLRQIKSRIEEVDPGAVREQLNNGAVVVDVREPEEWGAGHIPGARSIPWAKAANADGTFKSVEELQALYDGEDITPEKQIVAYCRIGERSSHTWFVLTRLLGYEQVKNYDGSWTEWGSLVGVPIAKGERP